VARPPPPRALVAGRLLGVAVTVLGLGSGAHVLGGGAAPTLPALLLAGGFGLALPALTGLGMSGAGEEDAGVASGLFNTTQQLGSALGVAVLTTLAAARAELLSGRGQAEAAALTGGFRSAFGASAALTAAAIVLAALVLRAPARGEEALPSAPEPSSAGRR